MNYNEMRTNHGWMLKQYPGIGNLAGLDDETTIGKLTTEHYEKVGSRWKLVKTDREDFTVRNYVYSVDAIPFFRNLGGRETVTMGYSVMGYLPIEISSISPDKRQKVKRTYRFL